MLWLLLTGCALLRPDRAPLNHQLEREVIALQMRNEQLRQAVEQCAAQPQPALGALHTELLQIFRDTEVTVTRDASSVQVSVPGDLLFASGTTRVRAEAAMPLDLLGVVLGVHPDVQVEVVGHTDDRSLGGALRRAHTDNWGLSAARAAAVARQLIEAYNVAPERLTIAGRGQTQPIADNATAAGQARNRRIEVRLRAP